MPITITTTPPPPIIVEHNKQKRGVCFHVDKPCFTLEAPKNNKKDQLKYYIRRMKAHAKKAQSPDLNMSLNEIRTGTTVEDHVKFSLLVYLLGVIAIFWINR